MEEQCVICYEYSDKSQMVNVYQYPGDVSHVSVHKSSCLDKWNALLVNKGARKYGVLIGACIYCGMPVRRKQAFIVRVGKEGGDIEDSYSTFPTDWNQITVAHKECHCR